MVPICCFPRLSGQDHTLPSPYDSGGNGQPPDPLHKEAGDVEGLLLREVPQSVVHEPPRHEQQLMLVYTGQAPGSNFRLEASSPVPGVRTAPP